MNIAIIDDISTDAEDLKNIAVFYFEKKQIQAEIYQFFSAEEFFEDYQPGKFQILFLDIYMNGSFRVIKRLMLTGRSLRLEVIGTEIVEKPCPCGSFLVTSQLPGNEPGEVRNIDTVHEPCGPLVVGVQAQLQELSVTEDVLHKLMIFL